VTDSELQPIGTIEVDFFCPNCQLNLFGQPVCRDQRLEILVSKCPGCSRFIAAGKASTAGNRWLQTMVNGILLGYITFLMLVILAGAIIMFATQLSYLEDLQYRNNTVTTAGYVYTIIGACITPGLLGLFLPVFCWHWKPRLRYLAVLVPVATAALAFVLWANPQFAINPYPGGAQGVVVLLGAFVLWQVGTFALALAIGRPFARLVLRLLVPAKILKVVPFLWTVDGKTPPG
jgi:hypothetical protein